MACRLATITFVTLLALTSIAGLLDAQSRGGGRGFHRGPARTGQVPAAGVVVRPAGPPPAFVRRAPIVPRIVGPYVLRPQTHIRFEPTPYLGFAPYVSPY